MNISPSPMPTVIPPALPSLAVTMRSGALDVLQRLAHRRLKIRPTRRVPFDQVRHHFRIGL
jgi:hypothetical protein